MGRRECVSALLALRLAGFKTFKVESVQLQLGQILKIDAALPVADLAEAVEVTAVSPIIDVKQNAAMLSLQAEIIDRIPKGRNFTSVLTSAPGTNDEPKAGISIDGATGSETRYVVDGLDTTNLRTGVSAKPVLTDFLAEVQVKSSGYNAEYRAATGRVVKADRDGEQHAREPPQPGARSPAVRLRQHRQQPQRCQQKNQRGPAVTPP